MLFEFEPMRQLRLVVEIVNNLGQSKDTSHANWHNILRGTSGVPYDATLRYIGTDLQTWGNLSICTKTVWHSTEWNTFRAYKFLFGPSFVCLPCGKITKYVWTCTIASGITNGRQSSPCLNVATRNRAMPKYQRIYTMAHNSGKTYFHFPFQRSPPLY